MEALLARVIDATRAAGEAILEVRAGAVLEIRQKVDGPVTAADLAANRLLEERLRPLVPQAAWLSEETADSSDRLSRRSVWVVDPLDGTQEFIQGTGDFGVSVGLVEDGRPVLGVLHFPTTRQTLWATRGGGAFERVGEGEARSLCVSKATGAVRLALRWAEWRRDWPHALKGELGVQLEPMGSTVRKLAAVATGEVEAYVTLSGRAYEWDVCAGELVIGEAGGVLTDLQGDAWAYNREDPRTPRGMIAATPSVHGRLLRALRGQYGS